MNNILSNFLNYKIFNNTLLEYLTALSVFIGLIILIIIIKKVILFRLKKLAERTKTKFDDFIIAELRKTLLPILIILSFDFSLEFLILPQHFLRVIHYSSVVLIAFFLIKFIARFFNTLINSFYESDSHIGLDKRYKSLSALINFFIWSTGILIVLNNLGFNITTILTGLGIGGIALALASQTILGDLFSYFVILFDKPFKIGDYIVLDNLRGNIEYIGIKTTKIRSLQGELIVISNSDLTKSRIHNFQKLEQRRYTLNLYVRYDTPLNLLEQIPATLEEIVKSDEKINFQSAVLRDLSDKAIVFEVVYYVKSSDYNEYLSVNNNVHYKILDYFNKNNIKFSYHTNVYLQNN